jgi:cytochrome P450
VLEDGSKLTDDQIVGMMIALLIAGQHTSNVTGTWTGLHLLLDRERLAKVRPLLFLFFCPKRNSQAEEELRQQIGGSEVRATFAQVKECVYLEHCVSMWSFVRFFFSPSLFRCASRCGCVLRSSR